LPVKSGAFAPGDGMTIDGASYTLDNAGNRTAKTDQRTAMATSYGYHNVYQLLKCGQRGSDCDKTCAPFVPKSSPGKPKFPGW